MSSLRTSTLIAVFRDQAQAEHAVAALHAAGFRPGQIEVMAGGSPPFTEDRDFQRLVLEVEDEGRFDEAREIISRFDSHLSQEYF